MRQFPIKYMTNLKFKLNHILLADRIICRFYKCVDVGRVDLFEFGSDMQTRYPQQLKMLSLQSFLARNQVRVHKMQSEMKSLSLQAVVEGHLAHPVQ